MYGADFRPGQSALNHDYGYTKLPPLAAYEQWHLEFVASLTVNQRRGAVGDIEAPKYRRAAVMHAQGCSYAEIGRAIGVKDTTVKRMLNRLPDELR